MSVKLEILPNDQNLSHSIIPIYICTEKEQITQYCHQNELKQLKSQNFPNKKTDVILLFNPEYDLAKVLFFGNIDDFSSAALLKKLPEGSYYFADPVPRCMSFYLGLYLACYQFNKYKSKASDPNKVIEILLPEFVSKSELEILYNAVALARDFINEPTNSKSGKFLAKFALDLAKKHQASCKIIEGDTLKEQFPLIHAVGKGSVETSPYLIDFTWQNDKKLPLVILVGKGVCFDSGGLGIKPASSMSLMKKDMGGAANILALAQMIMEANLPVALKILIPVVENAISGECFRPGDIYTSRKGLNIEIGHTDAEGRLILADALCYAAEQNPDILIDIATLTGAARIALGDKLVPFFTGNDIWAKELQEISFDVKDHIWRLPLYDVYKDRLASKAADLNNISGDSFAGCIIAALFLQHFVESADRWLHFDIYGWNTKSEDFAPIGGEAQAIRAIYFWLKRKYCKGVSGC